VLFERKDYITEGKRFLTKNLNARVTSIQIGKDVFGRRRDD
jgi:hypothetical protein